MHARNLAPPAWLLSPSFAPLLRADIRFVPHGEHHVRLYDQTQQHYVQLYRLELHVAQLMNGRRGLDEITAIACQYNHELSRTDIERLVMNLNLVGLLDRASTPPPLPNTPPDLLSWQSQAAPGISRLPILVASPTALALPDRPSSAISPLRGVPPPGAYEQGLDDATQMDGTTDLGGELAAELGDGLDDPPAPQDEAAPAAEEAAEEEADQAEEAPAEEQPSPEEIAAQEQEQLLQAERKRWHQRGWVRALLVLAVVVGVSALIPYPLRITSECVIIPSERAKVRSELEGVLAEILVDEGQWVEKGDVIARLDTRALKADQLKVQAEIEKIEAQIAILKQGRRPEEIEQQKAVLAARKNEVAFAAREAQRRSAMVREGVGSRQAADEAARELETKRRAVTEAEAALKLLKAGSRPEEISAEEAVLKRARAELSFIEQKLAMSEVRAPIAGEILTPRFRERVSEGVNAGGLVCEIANTRRVRAEVLVPEREVDTIALGMPATVKVESYPTQPFEGKVDFIAPAVGTDDGRVRVVVEIDNPGGLLKANMTGYGEVEAGDRSLLQLATRRFVRWFRVRFLL